MGLAGIGEAGPDSTKPAFIETFTKEKNHE